MAYPAVEPPAPWNCLEDRLTAFLERHPEYDTDDAIEALIWGEQEESDNEDEH